MRRKALFVGLLTLGALSVVSGFLMVSSGAVLEASPADRIRACLRTQGESTMQNPETVSCLRDALVDAARTDSFGEVLTLRTELLGTAANASCHAAGHAAGAAMVEEFTMQGALDRMFTGPVPEADQVCVAAVVHGLVAGEASGEPPYPLDYIANECRRLDGINEVYTYECAHFFGHSVWRSTQSLTTDLAVHCGLLGTDGLVKACMSGAVMQKFDLQSKHYDPDNSEAKKRTPPDRTELEHLCDVFVDAGSVPFDGCMGAVGWLAAISVDGDLPYEGSDSPAWVEQAFDLYMDRISLCEKNFDCQDNFINHFRVEAYWNGVAERVCVADEVPEDACEHVLTRFQAVSPGGDL